MKSEDDIEVNIRVVTRRLVLFIGDHGSDDSVAKHDRIRREFKRFKRYWGVRGQLTPLEIEKDNSIAKCSLHTSGPNWNVTTAYEFLEWSDLFSAEDKRQGPLQILRTIRSLIGFLRNQQTDSSWRAIFFNIRENLLPLLIDLIAAAAPFVLAIALWFAVYLANAGLGVLVFSAILLGGLAYLAFRFGTSVVISDAAAPTLLLHALSRRPDVTERIERFAREISERARAGNAEDILLVAHGAGSILAIRALACAIDSDPALLNPDAPLTLVTLASPLALALMDRRDVALRNAVVRIASEPLMSWVDCKLGDGKAAENTDPVGNAGIGQAENRWWPVNWNVPPAEIIASGEGRERVLSRSVVSPPLLAANVARARYDYFIFVCGPLPFSLWACNDWRAVNLFAQDAALRLVEPPA